MIRIVFNHVRDAINARIDQHIAEHPEDEADREHLYDQMLDYYDHTGQIPTTITRTRLPSSTLSA